MSPRSDHILRNNGKNLFFTSFSHFAARIPVWGLDSSEQSFYLFCIVKSSDWHKFADKRLESIASGDFESRRKLTPGLQFHLQVCTTKFRKHGFRLTLEKETACF